MEDKKDDDGVWAVTLDKLAEAVSKSDGIDLKDIESDHVVEVRTQNSIYTVTVMNAEEKKIVIFGNNKYFLEPEIVFLSGSSFGGCMLVVGQIKVGMLLEVMGLDKVRTTTSTVMKITVFHDPKRADDLRNTAVPKKLVVH